MNSMCALYLCASILSTEPMKESTREVRVSACVDLVEKAIEHEQDELIIIAIAHTESRFNVNAVSKAGARGILQVLPKYFCPKKGKCDYTAAGFKAWAAWSKNRSLKEALCRYNSGQKCSNSKRARYYSRVVLRKYAKLLEAHSLEKDCSEPGC